MKAQTLSIIAGNEACNARCPYCISKMTPSQGVSLEEPEVNWRNLEKAAQLARDYGVSTALITGKGEPTFFPEQITKYLQTLKEYNFPLVELQTNGVLLNEQREKYQPYLQQWYDLGLTTVAVSIVHYNSERNKEVFLPHKKKYPELSELVDDLHNKGLSVRLSCVLADGYIDNVSELEKLVGFAKENKVEQLTIRPVNRPGKSRDQKVASWTDQHHLKEEQLQDIQNHLEKKGNIIMQLAHGATVYDLNGQNVCLTHSLTLEPKNNELRQLIFFPDGHLRYDWQFPGAIIL